MAYKFIFVGLSLTYTILSPIISYFLPIIKKEIVLVNNWEEWSTIQSQGHNYPVLSTIGMIEQHGYFAEEHSVTTKDGYILKVYRITGNSANPKAEGKPVAFLQHGYVQSSDSFVSIGPDSDLAFLLVNAGYDVWLGNVRGNTYSKSHVSISPANKEFWEFSFHEYGTIDLPTMIDYVLKETAQKDLTYYGFSLGTAMSYIMLSTLPEYNDKMNMVYSLGPVAFWNYDLKQLTRQLYAIFGITKEYFEYFNVYNIVPQSALVAWIGEKYCSPSSKLFQPLCAFITGTYLSFDYNQLNKTALPTIVARNPAGSSRYVHYHFEQNIRLKAFRPYDWGSDKKNIKVYGKAHPTDYNLHNIRAPISLWYGENDFFINKKDVFDLSKMLSNVTVNRVSSDKFNHVDFLWAMNVKSVLYDHIIKKSSPNNTFIPL